MRISKIVNNLIEAKHFIEQSYKDKDIKTPIIVTISRGVEYKSQAQNSCFHNLLDEFEKSGQHSFSSYTEMRDHYKEIAGLIEWKKIVNFTQEEKNLLHSAIKILPLAKSTKDTIYKLLKGER